MRRFFGTTRRDVFTMSGVGIVLLTIAASLLNLEATQTSLRWSVSGWVALAFALLALVVVNISYVTVYDRMQELEARMPASSKEA